MADKDSRSWLSSTADDDICINDPAPATDSPVCTSNADHNPKNKVFERVSHISQLLKDWSWSFPTLVKYWIKHQGGAKGKRSLAKTADILRVLMEDTKTSEITSKALREDRNMVSSLEMATSLVVEGIRFEFSELRENSSTLAQWDSNADVSGIGFCRVAKEVQERAPLFSNLMFELGHNTTCRGGLDHRDEPQGYIVMIASILLLKASRNTANSFARMLGLYLQGTGLRRRAIQVLHGLGITEAYCTLDRAKKALSERSETIIRQMALKDDITVFYDNFDYLQKSRHQILGDHGVMYNYTTAKLVRAGYSRIPEGGLSQRMINNKAGLQLEDIIHSDDIKNDQIWKAVSTSCIFNAIKRIYPTAVDKIYSVNNATQPAMPEVDILPCSRTEHITLGAITENEATVSGNYKVLENIFLEQLGLDPNADFQDPLYLVYGDQKTCCRIRSCQRQRGYNTLEKYHQLKWVLPVTGLWHLRLNYLQMVMKAFYGGQKHSELYSTLYTQINFLDRRNIPKESAPFHYMEELLLHSFDARILGMLYVKIGDECDVKNTDKVETYLSNLSLSGFELLVSSIYEELFSQKVRSGSARILRDTAEGQVPQIDMEFVNSIFFVQSVEVYIVLKHAIKHADLGLLRKSIARCCLMFHGSTSRNYAREMLHLYHLIATKAAAPELGRAVLSCGLVNLRGRPDSFFEADRLVEILNLQLKELMWSRGNSTFNVDSLFQWGLSLSNYYLPVRAAFELAFGERTNAEHTVKSCADDIHSLGELLSHDSLRRRRHRYCEFSAPSMMYDGFKQLTKGNALQAFNTDINSTGDTRLDAEGGGENDDTIDIYATDHLTANELQELIL